MQPVDVFTRFSKCLVAGLSKGENLVPKHCPLLVGNDEISHGVILFYFYFPLRFAFHRMSLCAKVCASFQSAKQWGTAGKNRETKGKTVFIFALLFCLSASFTTSVLVNAIQRILEQISTYLSCFFSTLVPLCLT